MYARARESELPDMSTPMVQMVRCASELNYRVLLSPKDPWIYPDPKTFPAIDKLAQILLTAPTYLLPDC